MSITKDFRYKVGSRLGRRPDHECHARRTSPSLTVATPPEFKNGVPGVWSPEDLLVASAALLLRRDPGRGRRAA